MSPEPTNGVGLRGQERFINDATQSFVPSTRLGGGAFKGIDEERNMVSSNSVGSGDLHIAQCC